MRKTYLIAVGAALAVTAALPASAAPLAGQTAAMNSAVPDLTTEVQWRGRGWGGGFRYGGGWGGYRGSWGGYRAGWGGYRGGWGYRGYRGWGVAGLGAAIVTGAAIAATAPYYGYGYGYPAYSYSYYPAYYAPTYSYVYSAPYVYRPAYCCGASYLAW
jgi:hypothetical protein